MALETAATYPLYFAVTEDNRIARWRPLVQYIMAIPHLVIAGILGYASQFCSVIAWFVIMFTGRLPAGLANFMIMAQRFNARATGYSLGLTEQYPPFDFDTTAADAGNYAIRLDVRPELENRNRTTVFFRIFMVIPIAVFSGVILIGAYLVALVAWFAVLFTGHYPVGMRDFVIKALRLLQRVTAYGSLLTDQYPPFALQ